MMHALCSLPPACLAVAMTLFVMTGELAFLTFHSSSSHGMTCSIWYLRRNATLVTSAGGRAEGIAPSLVLGNTRVHQSKVSGVSIGDVVYIGGSHHADRDDPGHRCRILSSTGPWLQNRYCGSDSKTESNFESSL